MSQNRRRIGWRNLLSPSYKSRSDEFLKLFGVVIPPTERLIADYSCALHREILIQGRLYISVNYIAFYANIFGWMTKLVVPLQDISEVLKANTAKIIPNAIQVVTTTGEKHVFASFLTRDKSFVMVLRVWHNNKMYGRMSSADVRNLVRYSYRNLGMKDEDLIVSGAQSNNNLVLTDGIPECDQEDKDSVSDESIYANCSTPKARVSPFEYHRGSASRLSRRSLEGPMSEYNQVDILGEVESFQTFLQSTGDQVVDVSSSQEYMDVEDGSSSLSYKDVVSTFADDRESLNLDSLDDFGRYKTKNVHSENLTSCNCDSHEGHLIEDLQFDIDVITLSKLIFTNSNFMRKYRARRGMRDAIISSWEQRKESMVEKEQDPVDTTTTDLTDSNSKIDETIIQQNCNGTATGNLQASHERELKYSMDLNHVLAKKVHIQEVQSISQAEPGVLVLKSRSNNSGIPYGETFSVDTTYCLTRTLVPGKSRMLVHTVINFKEEKTNWRLSMVKNMIEKQSIQGVKDFVSDLRDSINHYISNRSRNDKNKSNSLCSFSSVSTLGT